MTDTTTVFSTAAARGAAKSLPYAGEVTPREAHHLQQHGAKIIDVRYPFENEYVGRVHGSSLAPWKLYPEGLNNPNFITQLRAVAKPDDIVLMLCRSGVRSHAAGVAAAAAGFTKVYNIIGGFEGDLDEQGHRGNRGGWRHAGLPWVQS
ncbi:MAG: rhodanese-like domain-containing protein [Rhodocyclaceae bacterium]|nr:rhodanese-like domain-containing protein [Rhodocyclaceae bacterium]